MRGRVGNCAFEDTNGDTQMSYLGPILPAPMPAAVLLKKIRFSTFI